MLQITSIYDLLLRGSERVPIGLFQLQLATAEQLCRLHYKPGVLKAVKARLKELTDNGFVQADAIPIKHTTGTKVHFSPLYYYTLAQKGMRYLERLGMDVHGSWRASKEVDKHGIFVTHTLELNDILIAAALLNRVDSRYHLDSFLHERVLKRRPIKVAWNDFGTKQHLNLIPDAFVDLRFTAVDGSRRRMPMLLEHDRGTEEQFFFRRKIRAYITLLKSEAYKQLFQVGTITILFTTFVGEQRLKQMRSWTKEELADTNESTNLGFMFYFASLAPPITPEQVWFTNKWHLPYDGEPINLLT
jgi:hypothetical protein